MRKIDADALYETLERDVSTLSESYTWECALGKSLMKDICLEIIKNAPAVDGWICVKDRQPDEDGRYVVVTMDGYVGIYYRVDGSWMSNAMNLCEDGYVTHWMPLPEPPKEEKE